MRETFHPKGIVMKTILALLMAFFVSSAFAQGGSGSQFRHMFQFDAESALLGTFNFDKSKTKGSAKADNDTQLRLNLNYAYALPYWKQIQLGSRVDYVKTTATTDSENYGFEVGAFYNFAPLGADSIDLTNSFYVSAFVGMNWTNTYGGAAAGHDEFLTSTFAFGKRFSLKRLGMDHMVYTPEIALVNSNSTTGNNVEYSQNVQLRFLQFSVFF